MRRFTAAEFPEVLGDQDTGLAQHYISTFVRKVRIGPRPQVAEIDRTPAHRLAAPDADPNINGRFRDLVNRT